VARLDESQRVFDAATGKATIAKPPSGQTLRRVEELGPAEAARTADGGHREGRHRPGVRPWLDPRLHCSGQGEQVRASGLQRGRSGQSGQNLLHDQTGLGQTSPGWNPDNIAATWLQVHQRKLLSQGSTVRIAGRIIDLK
jgi:hypothetical protein